MNMVSKIRNKFGILILAFNKSLAVATLATGYTVFSSLALRALFPFDFALVVLFWPLKGGYIGKRKPSLSRPVVIPAKVGIHIRDTLCGSDWPQL